MDINGGYGYGYGKGGGGGRRTTTTDFYRRVPKEMTEVSESFFCFVFLWKVMMIVFFGGGGMGQ